MTDRTTLSSPLTLPCGAILQNRIAKAAMTEGLADEFDDPTPRLERLYRRWSLGGAALHVTGNVMLDRRHLERAGNVVLDEETDLDALAKWARAGTEGGNHLWMQVNHPGRQAQKTTSRNPVAPSEVGLKLAGFFAKPRALQPTEIRALIKRYEFVAERAKEAGFTGVQVHSAHGYLSNQFLSPRTNRRTDEWGGSLENRARYLLEAVRAVRGAVGDAFPVSVKLNSADFQKGGFTNDDAAQVARWLQDEGVDLLEISGGTYESSAFIAEAAESTRKREAYFLEYAGVIREHAPDVPIMVTGGFRTASVMEDVVANGGCDVIGLARPFCVEPEFPRSLLAGTLEKLPTHERDLFLGDGALGPKSSSATVRVLNTLANTSWYYHQIVQLADGQPLDLDLSAKGALARHMKRDTTKALKRKRHGRR